MASTFTLSEAKDRPMGALHVVLYHPARLPVVRYGGTERVVVWLARGLAELGHRVSLISHPQSRLAEATLIPIDPGLTRVAGGPDLTAYLPAGADLLHAHVPLRNPPAELPFCWTLHGNTPPDRAHPDTTIGVSADHARRHRLTRWVHNGVDPADYHLAAGKGRHDLFLGRLHGVKGWRWAVEGARRSGHPLVIAGGWRPSFRPGLRFAGRVGGGEKRALLAEARCLWMPAQWDEPFGLTLIEAMASGTPVLGTRRGALPEIVSGSCGALGDTLEELIALRPTLDALDPEQIRNRVLERFTHRVMAERYVGMYRGVGDVKGER
ncbi:MAG: glycosyltransferase [Gemmatimonadales bacterium]|nr:glycosyltransferase [Gemmatimonadales bacterium]